MRFYRALREPGAHACIIVCTIAFAILYKTDIFDRIQEMLDPARISQYE